MAPRFPLREFPTRRLPALGGCIARFLSLENRALLIKPFPFPVNLRRVCLQRREVGGESGHELTMRLDVKRFAVQFVQPFHQLFVLPSQPLMFLVDPIRKSCAHVHHLTVRPSSSRHDV